MTHEEKVVMTNSLWLVTTFYKTTAEVKEELEAQEADDDELLRDTKENLSHIYGALERMNPKDAEIFKERILSGEAFKGVCYGDALQLTDEEQAACEAFGAYYYPSKE